MSCIDEWAHGSKLISTKSSIVPDTGGTQVDMMYVRVLNSICNLAYCNFSSTFEALIIQKLIKSVSKIMPCHPMKNIP